MSGFTGHLARRAVEGIGAIRTASPPPRVVAALKDIENFNVPAWFPIASFITALLCIISVAAVDYSLGGVMATLSMVESPSQETYEAPPQYEDVEDADAPLLSETEKVDSKISSIEPELLPAREAAPITSSICSTLEHLSARGGRFAKYRGLRVNIITHVLAIHLTQFFKGVLPLGQLTSFFLAPIVTTTLLAPLMMTWTHIVISEPSPKYWFRRIPDFKTVTKVLPATVVYAVSSQLLIFLPSALVLIFDLPGVSNTIGTADDPKVAKERLVAAAGQAFVVLAVTVFTFIMIMIPADVTLTRVQASLLPESDEPIVPMDRSFGGRFISERVGGSGTLGVMDAWRTFDWTARGRLVKLYAKIFFIEAAILVTFVTIFAFEAGIAFRPIMCKSHMVVHALMRGDIKPDQL